MVGHVPTVYQQVVGWRYPMHPIRDFPHPNRAYWRAVAMARNRWIAGLPEMQGVEDRLAQGGSTLLSGAPAPDGSTGEADLLGDVQGRQLLHLGCGPGHDSVSWANLGARVTAVDFAEDNLRECRRLAALGATAGLPSRVRPGGRGKAQRAPDRVQILVADALELPFRSASFDVVYAAGIVAWIGDLARFYREIARVLVPGGRLLAVEEHPMRMVLDEDGVPDPTAHPYRDQALRHEIDATALPWPMRPGEWETDDYLWTTETLVTGIIEAGLQIEKLLEPVWSHSPAGYRLPASGAPEPRSLESGAWSSKPASIPTCLVVMANLPK